MVVRECYMHVLDVRMDVDATYSRHAIHRQADILAFAKKFH